MGLVKKIGWVTYKSFPLRKGRTELSQLEDFNKMRVAGIAQWINKNKWFYHNEIYHPSKKYDLVIFVKMMDDTCQEEVKKIKAYGGKVIFDANVNYYEIWGNYFVPHTKPTEKQQADAIWMGKHSDLIIADSSYITSIVLKYTDKPVVHIPDNIDFRIFGKKKKKRSDHNIYLIWSGRWMKSLHLLEIRDVLESLGKEFPQIALRLVYDKEPLGLKEIESSIKTELYIYSDERYADLLSMSDIIISPKKLINGYELGHTEYKISLGMASGLPAVCSPQSSYKEILRGNKGGYICASPEEWYTAIKSLVQDKHLLAKKGKEAKDIVMKKYQRKIIAQQYFFTIAQTINQLPSKNPQHKNVDFVETC